MSTRRKALHHKWYVLITHELRSAKAYAEFASVATPQKTGPTIERVPCGASYTALLNGLQVLNTRARLGTHWGLSILMSPRSPWKGTIGTNLAQQACKTLQPRASLCKPLQYHMHMKFKEFSIKNFKFHNPSSPPFIAVALQRPDGKGFADQVGLRAVGHRAFSSGVTGRAR